MSKGHEAHAFNYINRSDAEVRRQLLAAPMSVFRRAALAASSTGNPELQAKTGAIELSAETEIKIQ